MFHIKDGSSTDSLMDGFHIPIIENDLAWSSLPEATTLRAALQKAFQFGGHIVLAKSDWRVSVTKQFYFLTHNQYGVVRALNKNPKNIDLHLYSEGDAIIDMLRVISVGSIVCDFFVLIEMSKGVRAKGE
jgi:hypothetical protein